MHTVDTMGKNISVSPGSTPDMTDNFNCGDYVLWNSGARGQCLFNTAIGIPGQALVCAFRRLDNLKTTRFTMAANLVYHYGKGIKVQGLADTIANYVDAPVAYKDVAVWAAGSYAVVAAVVAVGTSPTTSAIVWVNTVAANTA